MEAGIVPSFNSALPQLALQIFVNDNLQSQLLEWQRVTWLDFLFHPPILKQEVSK